MRNIYIKNVKIVYHLVWFLLFSLILTLSKHVLLKAQSVEIIDATVKVNLRSDLSTEFTYNLKIINYSSEDLVAGYSFDLPYSSLNLKSASLNNVPQTYVLNEGNNAKTLDIKFLTPLKPNESGALDITFMARGAIKKDFESFELIIPRFSLSNVKKESSYEITWDTNFYGELSFVNTYHEPVSAGVIKVNTNSLIILFFGNKLNIPFSFDLALKNQKGNVLYKFINLPQDNSSQTILYHLVEGLNFALTNDKKNIYGITKLQGNEEKHVKIEGLINVETVQDQSFAPIQTGVLADTSKFWSSLASEMALDTSDLGKLKKASDFMVNNLTITNDINQKFEPKNLMENLAGDYKNFEYTQLDLAYSFCAIASKLDSLCTVEYGYLLFPNISTLNYLTPHVWNRVSLKDGTVILVDVYSQYLSGITYFSNTQSFDRVKFGDWDLSETNDSLLGLIGENTPIERFDIKPSAVALLATNEQSIVLTLNFPQNAYSGEFYDAAMELDNHTNYVLGVNRIEINGNDMIKNLKFANYYDVLLLPKVKNQLELEHLRELDFLASEEKTLDVVLYTDNDLYPVAESSVVVFFKPDVKLMLLMFILINLLIVTLVFLIWKLRKKSRYFVRA